MFIIKTLVLVVSFHSAFSGVFNSPGFFLQQNPFTYPSLQYPLNQYPSQSAFVQFQNPQHQFVSVNRPQFVSASRPQIVSTNRPQFVAIHAERPQTVTSVVSSNQQRPSAVAVPVQQQQQFISNNIVAIQAERPAARKIVLPYPPSEVLTAPSYSYGYSVNDQTTGDQKSHQETRTGDNVVGRYSVVEPDGTLRVVSYTAGKDGFNAVVERTPGYAPANAPQPIKVVSRPIAVAKPVAVSSTPVAVAVPVQGSNFAYPYPSFASGFHFGG